MKRPLYLNRRLYELDLIEQNKYLGGKINTIKPLINTKAKSISNYNYYFNNNMSNQQST